MGAPKIVFAHRVLSANDGEKWIATVEQYGHDGVPYIPKSDYDAGMSQAVEIIERLQYVQNGCPLVTYQEAFDMANEMADKFLIEHGGK